jgi:hypothetical protein
MRCFHLPSFSWPSFNRNDWPSARGSALAEIFIRGHYTTRGQGTASPRPLFVPYTFSNFSFSIFQFRRPTFQTFALPLTPPDPLIGNSSDIPLRLRPMLVIQLAGGGALVERIQDKPSRNFEQTQLAGIGNTREYP